MFSISSFRKWTGPLMIMVLVAFLATIFLNWGMNRGNGGPTKATSAGVINGREISLQYFDQLRSQEQQQLERTSSGDNQYQVHMLPYQVWEKLVNETIMGDFYKEAGLYASADEVFDYLKHNPPPGVDTAAMFRTNGVFDTGKFVAILNDPRTYEYNPGLKMLEQQASKVILPGQKLETILEAALVPSRVEIEDFYKAQTEKAIFEYACFKGSAIKPDFSKITEDQIAKYYSSHKDKFKSDEQTNCYFVKFPKKATDRDVQSYYQELADLKKKILSEKDMPLSQAFAEEAKVSSDDDGSAQNGGDLGLIKRGQMVPEFDSVAFRADTGTVSDPIKTRFGWHLIYVQKKEKRDGVEMVEVRHILRKIVPSGETVDAMGSLADSLRKQIDEVGFVKAARALASRNPEVVFDSTGFFPKGNPIPGIGFVSGAGHFLYASGKNGDTVSERLENTDGIYLLKIKQRIPKGTLPLAAIKPDIAQILADSLHKDAVKAAAQQWASKVSQGPLAGLKNADSATINSGVTDTVTRVSPIPGIGTESKAAAVALALPVGKTSKLFEDNGNYYLVRPIWKGPAAVVPWGNPEMRMIIGQLMNQTHQKTFAGWYRSYRDRQKIVSNISKVYLD